MKRELRFRRLHPAPLSWQLSSQCSEMGNSPKPVAPPCGVPSLGTPELHLLVRPEGGGCALRRPQGLFACGQRAHRPEKSLRAFMDRLADALCGAPKWLKSTPERLSEKGYKQHSGGKFGWCRAGEIGRNTPLRRPGELRCRLLQGFSDSLELRILGRSPVRSSRQLHQSL